METHVPNFRTTIALAISLAWPAVQAMELATDNPDVKIRLDFTPKYSAAYRLSNPSAALTRFDVAGDPNVANEDDGDHNFKKGLISSRVDLLTEFDVTAKNFGMRVSGSGWYDSVYLRPNSYDGTQLFVAGVGTPTIISTASNRPGQAPNAFLPGTRYQHGKGAEVLDAFVYLKGDIDGMRGNLRIGKHTLQWGETLFFGQNGIANAQGPVDVSRILSVPAWQFKEVLLPVEQVSGSLQVTPNLLLGAYYQLKWRPSRLPGAGSYFSDGDYLPDGGTINFGVDAKGAPINLVYDRGADLRPRNSGQGGVQVKWNPSGGNYEFGLYAAQYHEKTPAVPVFDFVKNNVHLAFAEDVRTVGATVNSVGAD